MYIRQKLELFEHLGVFEESVNLLIYGSEELLDPHHIKAKLPIFKCKELSNCF
jgi:hypothetical protein